MSDETTLLPCPFCGGEARCYPSDAFNEGGHFEFVVQCSSVDNHTLVNDYPTEAEAIAAWNTRTTHDMLTAEQVREAIERNFGKVAVIDDGGEKVEWREGWVCNVGINYKAIADELNATFGAGECEMETDWDYLTDGIPDAPEDTWAYMCSSCNWSFRYDRGIKPTYCPNCGRAVKQ